MAGATGVVAPALEYVTYSDIHCEDALVLNIVIRMIIMLTTSTIYTPPLIEKEKWLLALKLRV